MVPFWGIRVSQQPSATKQVGCLLFIYTTGLKKGETAYVGGFDLASPPVL